MNLLLITLLSFVFNHASAQVALPKRAPTPKDNPESKAKILLGKTLYFEPRLSVDGTISCNSCHNLMAGGEDQRSVSVGVAGQKGGRSAPTVWNAAFHTTQFWDGRAASLEEQAVGPITNPIEMGMPSYQEVTNRLSSIPGYIPLFKNAFGKKAGITKENIGKAIAAFERTLLTPNSPFDRYKKGNKNALSKSAKNGLKLFQEKGCVSCHSGDNFSGSGVAMGSGFFQKFPVFEEENPYVDKYGLKLDGGRFEVTKNEADRGFWRVPSLRNIALTAPYFHNGSVKSLDEAVRVMAKSQLHLDLGPSQVNDLVSFLKSLTGVFPKIEMPRLPPTEAGLSLGVNVN